MFVSTDADYPIFAMADHYAANAELVDDLQKIVDANEKLIKELKYGTNTIS